MITLFGFQYPVAKELVFSSKSHNKSQLCSLLTKFGNIILWGSEGEVKAKQRRNFIMGWLLDNNNCLPLEASLLFGLEAAWSSIYISIYSTFTTSCHISVCLPDENKEV